MTILLFAAVAFGALAGGALVDITDGWKKVASLVLTVFFVMSIKLDMTNAERYMALMFLLPGFVLSRKARQYEAQRREQERQ